MLLTECGDHGETGVSSLIHILLSLNNYKIFIGECSVPCGTGYRIRQRKCDDPAPDGGLECIGCPIEYEICNKQPCIEVKKLSPFTPWLIVNNSEVGYIEKRFRYQCKATGNFNDLNNYNFIIYANFCILALSDPSGLKISLHKEETRTCNNDGGCHRMNEISPKSPTWGCWTGK